MAAFRGEVPFEVAMEERLLSHGIDDGNLASGCAKSEDLMDPS